MRLPDAWIILPVAVLTGCGTPTRQADQASPVTASETARRGTTDAEAAPASPIPVAMVTPAAAAATPTLPTRPLSCRADIGGAAAARRVAICRDVSPATHPPCNAANSCAMIDDEIARSCALFDGKAAPMRGCGPAPKSMDAAAAVVRRYYSAINARDYDTAWSQWGTDGPAGQTRARFEAGFAHTRATRVTVGALKPGEGAAGSIYQPVPVTVEATLDDGTHQRFRGTYVIRRVNGVDGATPDQLRWHIDSAKLRRVPG